eukprot:GFYU01006046.1.p2 GENE.GFYU01006046.1~~GFYU01006046.1.p2  ORF type:complete len:125 (+),score=2.64 GFYU01006046.1:976-1350(+)
MWVYQSFLDLLNNVTHLTIHCQTDSCVSCTVLLEQPSQISFSQSGCTVIDEFDRDAVVHQDRTHQNSAGLVVTGSNITHSDVQHKIEAFLNIYLIGSVVGLPTVSLHSKSRRLHPRRGAVSRLS